MGVTVDGALGETLHVRVTDEVFGFEPELCSRWRAAQAFDLLPPREQRRLENKYRDQCYAHSAELLVMRELHESANLTSAGSTGWDWLYGDYCLFKPAPAGPVYGSGTRQARGVLGGAVADALLNAGRTYPLPLTKSNRPGRPDILAWCTVGPRLQERPTNAAHLQSRITPRSLQDQDW